VDERQARINYLEGYLAALYDFAWYRNGTMYLGSGIRTYKEIAQPLEEELSTLKGGEMT